MARDIAILACQMHTWAEASLPYRRFEEGPVDLQIAIDATTSWKPAWSDAVISALPFAR